MSKAWITIFGIKIFNELAKYIVTACCSSGIHCKFYLLAKMFVQFSFAFCIVTAA